MDDDLSRRLIALRHALEPHSNKNRSTSILAPDKAFVNEEDTLAVRFEEIFNKPPASKDNKASLQKNVAEKGCKEEIPVEELINALNSENEAWITEQIDENEIEQLLREAKKLTPLEHTEKGYRKEGTELVPDWFRNHIVEKAKNDTDMEEDILGMIKDEIAFDAAHGIVPTENDEEPSQSSESGRSSTTKGFRFDEDLLKRFEALGGLELPPVPRMEPGTKQSPGFPSKSSEFDESDTWCCICNEDGEYRCSGCEYDIYCASCLYEAHTGPNAGCDERKHKWTKYIKPKKLAT